MKFIDKVSQKLKTFDRKDWIITSLWMLTLSFMFVFIGVAAGLPKSGNNGEGITYADSVAAVAIVFVILLITAIVYTVWTKYQQKKNESGRS